MNARVRQVVSMGGLLCVCAGVLGAGEAEEKSAGERQADQSAADSLFVLHYATGPEWVPERPFLEQTYAAEHSRNLSRLRDEGMIIVGARYADRGMLVLRAIDAAAVRAEIEMDPMVAESVFVYDLYPLSVFYEGCVERPERE